jgi:hypothetical protein
MIAGRNSSRQPGRPMWKGIREEEKTYFEYLIENEPLLQEPFGMLIDGEALPAEYCGKQMLHHISPASIQWGRIVRNIHQTVNFQQIDRDLVEAVLMTTLEGALKISAPYHLSRRRRHAVLFKPFCESCVQKVTFRRSGNSADPERAWRLDAVSVGVGGTEHPEVEIDLLRVRGADDVGYQVQSPLLQMLHLNDAEDSASPLVQERQLEVEVRIRSREMEQNMVVLRSAADDDTVWRTQLQYLADNPDGAGYLQTYCGSSSVAHQGRFRAMVVESILRSSLFDTGAPVQTCYWIVPLKSAAH